MTEDEALFALYHISGYTENREAGKDIPDSLSINGTHTQSLPGPCETD